MQDSISSLSEDVAGIKADLAVIKDFIMERETCGTAGTKPPSDVLARDCSELSDGVADIITESGRKFQAKCEDGWLIVANREDGSVDFNKNWQDFKDGFGSLNGEHFLGFENIRSVLTQGKYEMRTSFTSWEPETRYIDYENVSISDEATGYRLKYKWPATKGTMNNANGLDLAFTTKDRDNDSCGDCNCAIDYKGPGWFGRCLASNQFGPYIHNSTCPEPYFCMTWGSGWPESLDGTKYNSKYSFKAMDMKIKPSNTVPEK
ncbi:unnamed protein product [Owenia fusiformis]|uniref:Uncharacterized protein n=1 Tax=Owenia fusiformis TaxID=6347 RepID=A0A8J1UHT8_OWEFU|nr:unnamed protein product [Owenia fusiformis]